jgi:F-type H+-transporting ATPase subunit epsilon
MAQKKPLELPGTSSLTVHMVTPTGSVADEETDAITAPGELGEFEVLPQHVPFLTGLHPGVLVLGEKRERQVFAVSRGYLRVDDEGQVEVLVEKAIAAADVDTEAAAADRDEVATTLDKWSEAQNAEWKNLKARFDWAQAQIDAAAVAA